MTSKRFVVMLGAAILVELMAIGFSSRPIDSAVPRQFSARALSIISAVDPTARVKVEDLDCSVKVGWGLAQCGSQASSCKNCHEVKGEDPVNAKGDWHISHAFGDFCEFCHAGNVAATDKAAAHEGLVEPLGDVKTNCSMCHSDDLEPRAEKYATVLGVTVGVGGSNTSSGGSTGSDGAAQQPATNPSEPAQPASQPDQAAAPQPAVSQPLPAATPSSNLIVDYVALYKATQPTPQSSGTAVVSLLLAATVVGGGVFVFWNEMRLRAKKRVPVSAVPVAVTDERSRELAQIVPLLEKMDAQALRGLHTFLSNRQ
jgi:hypothetical protein